MQSGLRRKQRGATFLGTVIIVAILGLGLYAGIRLVPIYKEYMDVSRALTQTASQLGGGASVAEVRNSLGRRWEVDDITRLDYRNVEVTPVGGGALNIRAKYRAEAPFIGNVSLVVDFDKSVRTGSSGP
jgi:hypothetical protein